MGKSVLYNSRVLHLQTNQAQALYGWASSAKECTLINNKSLIWLMLCRTGLIVVRLSYERSSASAMETI